MDLLHYLTQKSVTAVFCPHCYSWLGVTGESTIAEYFDDEYPCDFKNRNSFKNYWCDNKDIIISIQKPVGFPRKVNNNYSLKVRNTTLYFSGYATYPGCDGGRCLMNNPIEGSISIQDIANNYVLSRIHDGYLDIYFHIDCHPPFPCSKCGIYGPEEYYYKCKDFENIMTSNVLYYHEHDIRSHYTILLGFRFNLDEGDSVFNTEKLRRAYNSLKHKLVISRFSISALKKQIYMLQTYILKDSNELQALDTIDKELETLSTQLVKLNRKVSNLYGISENSDGYSEEYDTSKIRTQAINEIYPSLDWEDYKRRYAIYQKKIRDYIEQKASEVLKTYEGIQSEVSKIKDRVDSISETLKQIQHKHSLKF